MAPVLNIDNIDNFDGHGYRMQQVWVFGYETLFQNRIALI